MHYKTNRQNHDFQIAYFIAGSCQTADAAYSILTDLKEDRGNAIKLFEAAQLREQAKIIRANRLIGTGNEEDQLEGQADLVEIAALSESTRNNYNAALEELSFIEKCMDKLMPYRKYAHLPDHIAHEAAQQEEWKLQLVHTAENFILSGGTIPHDHWGTMRMHPEFATGILPLIEKTQLLIAASNMPAKTKEELAQRELNNKILAEHLHRRDFELPEFPKLLAKDNTTKIEDQR